MRANGTYSEAKGQFSDRNRDMFLRTFSPLISGGPLLSLRCSARVHRCLRSLVRVVDWCESVGKADLLSDHFDSKQSREAVDLPLTCHPSPSLTTFAFRSSEVKASLVRLGPLWWHRPIGYVSFFS